MEVARDQAGFATQPWRRAARFPVLLLLAVLAFVAGFLIVWSGSGASQDEPAWLQSYRAWGVLVGVFFVVGGFAALAMIRQIGQLNEFRRFVRLWVTGLVIVLYALVATGPGVAARASSGGLATDLPDAINSLSARIGAINFIGSFLLLPGLIVLDWSRQTAECGIGVFMKDDKFDVDRFLRLRRAVNTAIFALGGVFTVALLATAALRTAILDAGGDYSKVQLLLFGVQYTGLLLVLYWPAQAELNSIAQTARDNVVAPPALADDNLAALTDERTAIDSLLGSTSTPLEGFRTRAALAAPLVTALATSLITAE